MALNTKYMLAPSLEEYFVDKTTGFPLAAGKVYFYSDINRSTLKPIFTISGTAPDYSYVQLPNPVTLSSVGTFQDGSGNNVLPYYYPYDADGNVENYFIRVFDYNGIEDGIQQFTREGFPNIGSTATSAADSITNFIPNGQFKIHNNLEIIVGETAGTVADPITNIAQGGWTFERPMGSISNDIVTFQPLGSYVINPTTSPSFVFNLQTLSAGSGDLFKDLRVNFDDVNKFASDVDEFTFYFEGQTNVGTTALVNVVLIKDFGAGGSTTVQEVIEEIELTNTYQSFNVPIIFGDNLDKTIGTGSKVSIAIRFPNNPQNISLVNFALVPADVVLTQFPHQTDADMRTRGIAGWMPTPSYDRNDIGLPLILSEKGLDFDRSVVGKIYPDVCINSADQSGYLLCDGSQIDPTGYGANGAPYSRLQSRILFSFGNGIFFAGPTLLNGSLSVLVKNNTPGVATPMSDGTAPTGFTFSDVSVGATTYGVKSFLTDPHNFVIWNNTLGEVTDVDLATSGFSSTLLRMGSTLTAQITQINPIIATTLAGKYFTFQIPGPTNFYVWFTVDGSGADPAPGGTGIQVNLKSNDDVFSVARKCWSGVSGCYAAQINTVAASAMTSGCYFNFNVLGGSTTSYYMWYTIDGLGTDPAPSGRSGIRIDLASSDTMADVLNKTHNGILNRYISLPDLRGMGLRGNDINGIYDTGTRFNFIYGNTPDSAGTNVGTYELDSFLSHTHVSADIEFWTDNFGGPSTITTGSPPNSALKQPFLYAGQKETVGYNAAVNFFIKY